MSILRKQLISADDSGSVDAFGRWRVSNLTTLFDSKQLHDKLPLFWDEDVVTSGGTTSVHSSTDANTVMTVGAASGDRVIRQTKMRFNYESGKSQLALFTFVLNNAVANTNKKIGYFNTSTTSPYTANEDGLYLEQDGTTQNFVVAKNGTTNSVAQANWNKDPFDGTGPSGITLDWTKTLILAIDFQWLGVGRVRFGFDINGTYYPAHEFNHANSATSVYMSSPNHSCRYEIRSTGGTASMRHICSSVATEGGDSSLGILFYGSTQGTHVDCNTENTLYAIVGIRLKADHLDSTVRFLNMALQVQNGDIYGEWVLVLNPTVAGTFTYSDITDSCCQKATGATANTVTGGFQMSGGYTESSSGGKNGAGGSASAEIINALRLASKIDGTVDEIVLCFRPIGGSVNADVEGAVFWRELT